MNIGIIGCGWLGKPLSTHLSHKHQVTCFSREHTLNTFWDNELFIISISTKENYLKSLQAFLSQIKSNSPIILMSSTSVYKEFDEEVNEETEITTKTLQKEAEELIQNAHKNLLILRLGGLMGKDRIAGRWKSVSSFTDSPVNYIIDKRILTGIFNLVAPLHPLRSKVHKKNSQDFGFQLGDFQGITQRIVNADKIIKTLEYNFIHPDPLEFWT